MLFKVMTRRGVSGFRRTLPNFGYAPKLLDGIADRVILELKQVGELLLIKFRSTIF